MTPRDVGLLAEAWVTLLAWRALVQFRGGWTLRKALAVPAGRGSSDDELIGRVARLLGIASRHHIVTPTCFHRSLALCTLLRRRRIAATVRVAIWKNGKADITGHAWVEVEGRVVGDVDSLAQLRSMQIAQ